MKVEVVCKDFSDVSLETCLKRDKKRENSVGDKVIKDMYNKYVKKEEPNYMLHLILPDEELTDCIIVDIDGTMAIHNGRSPYDFDKCDTDIPNQALIRLIRKIVFSHDDSSDVEVFFFSGRENSEDDSVWKKTYKWLTNMCGLDPMLTFKTFDLVLRKHGDHRNDAVVKEEMYNAYIKDQYNVLCVIDDRKRVVDHWRSMGLLTFQINDGDF
jgi:hypothetical protein